MNEKIESNIFDKCAYFTDCIVEVLTNSITGEVSIGWYRTDNTREHDTLEEAYNYMVGE